MIKIICPKCKKLVIEQPDWVVSYYDSAFKCKNKKCKHEGRLSYVNPKYKA